MGENYKDKYSDYLKHKHTGGLSNQKGNTYEALYATKEIVRLLYENQDPNEIYFASQVENEFVDDFWILTPDKLETFHQIKSDKSLSWGFGNKGDLLFDFKCQKNSLEEEGRYFILKIVYSNAGTSVHKNDIPEPIRSVTIKEYFPYYPTISQWIQSDGSISNQLNQIFNYPIPLPLDEQQSALQCIKSQWLELTGNNTVFSLSQLKEQYNKMHKNTPTFLDVPNDKLPEDVMEILSKIENLRLSVNGMNLYWEFKEMNGTLEISDEWIKNLLKKKPTNFMDLLSLML